MKLTMRLRKSTDHIVLHCSATPPSMDIGVSEIRKWHVDGNGWDDCGYHLVIRRNGIVEAGRHLDEAGAHVKGHNAKSVGVCLVGGVNDSRVPEPNYTLDQWASARQTCIFLLRMWPNAKIVGHNDLTEEKACPSFRVWDWWITSGVSVIPVA